MSSTVVIIEIIALVIICAAVLIPICVDIWKNKDCTFKEKLLQNFVFVIALSIAVCFAIFFANTLQSNLDKEHEIEEKSQSYTLYIDGIQVDKDKINIGSYDVSSAKIDDEKREIYFSTGGSGLFAG